MGRSMKVGREEIAGLIVALEAYIQRDHAADARRWLAVCQAVANGLHQIDEVSTRIFAPPEVSLAHAIIRLPNAAAALRAASELQSGRPRVFVGTMRLGSAELVVLPNDVRDDEVEALVNRLRQVVRG
jgi:D-glucosaminate-6-phosphate ammonia-lyase